MQHLIGPIATFLIAVRWLKKVEILKHHSDFSSHFVEVTLRCRHLNAVEPHPSRIGACELVDAAKEGALARAAWPNDDNDFTSGNVKRYAPEDIKVAIPFVQIADTNDLRFWASDVHLGSALWSCAMAA